MDESTNPTPPTEPVASDEDLAKYRRDVKTGCEEMGSVLNRLDAEIAANRQHVIAHGIIEREWERTKAQLAASDAQRDLGRRSLVAWIRCESAGYWRWYAATEANAAEISAIRREYAALQSPDGERG